MNTSECYISVVVISFNGREFIDDCLSTTCESLAGVDAEIIVVDNGSADGTLDIIRDKYPNVSLIPNDTNLGFARAVNQGLTRSRGEFILLLNQDTRIRDRAIIKLAERMKRDDRIGTIGPKFVGFDGRLQFSARAFPRFRDLLYAYTGLSRVFPRSKIFNRWKMGWFDHETEMAVEQPMGSALLIRRQVVDRVGLFDERFEIFFNDVDYCRRVVESGYSNLYYPDAVVEHFHGGSVKKMRPRMVYVWHRAMYRYLRKYNRGLIHRPLLYFWGAVLFVSALVRSLYYRFSRN